MKIKKIVRNIFLCLAGLFVVIIIFSIIKVYQENTLYSTLTTSLQENNPTQALEILNNLKAKQYICKKQLSSILLEAINKNYIELAKNIIQSINSDNKSQDDWKPHEKARYKNNIKNTLLKAIKLNQLEIVKALLEKEADPNYKEYEDKSPLVEASIVGNLKIVKELIQKGAQITDSDSYNKTTPLIEAAKHGHTEIVHELLSLSKIPFDEKNTALLHAATHGHSKIIKILLKHHANIDHMNNNRETLLMNAAIYGHLELVKDLLKEQIIVSHINQTDYLNQTALGKAIENNHIAIVKELLKIPTIKIDTMNCHYKAAQKGYTDILEELLKMQSNEEIIRGCIYYAIAYNHPKTIKELILYYKNKIFDKEHLEEITNHCLLYSAKNGHAELAKLLLEINADPNTQDSDKNTPLILAARYNHIDIVKLLLDVKANPNIQSKYIVEDESWLDESPYRDKSPRYVTVQNDWTALHYADDNNNKKIIELLLKAGADPNIKDTNGKAALSKTNK